MKSLITLRLGIWSILFLFPFLLSAQKGWQWQNPLPQGNLLRNSVAFDSTTILMVGDAGTIIKSKDGGDTWDVKQSKTRQDLYAIASFGLDCAVAVGTDGVILQTKDCGETWNHLNSGRKDTLRGISLLSTLVMVAVGDTGTILRSIDGGLSWNYQPFPGLRSNLNGVQFPTLSSGLGAIVGDSMLGFGGPPIIVSEDSGVSYVPWGGGQSTFESKSFSEVWMPKADPNKAVLVGKRGLIMNTHDAGLSWNAPLSGTTVDIKDVFFFTDKDGFAVGPGGVMLRTRNCGDSWEVIPTPILGDIITVSFPKDSTGVFGGGNGGLFRTPDGGSSFEPLWSGFRPDLTAITFLDDSFGIAVGGGGSILRTENAGQDWLPGPLVTTDPFEGITSTPIFGIGSADPIGHNIWIAGGRFGSFGRIYHSADSGKTFKPQPVFALSKFFDITFRDSLNGLAVGLSGMIFCTKDGGKTWTQKTSGTNKWLLDVEWTNDSSAFIAGGEGTLLHTTDGGQSWSPLNSGTQEWLTSVAFLDDSFGIATGNHGVILRTEDAGQNWQDVSPSPGLFKFNGGFIPDFTGISFRADINFEGRGVNPKDVSAVAVGYAGTIAFTPDGGDSWSLQDSKTGFPITDVFFTDSLHGTVVGHRGTILRNDSLVETTVSLEPEVFDQGLPEGPLGLAYPNPVLHQTRIPFTVPHRAPVDLRVFDIQGRMVSQLVNESLPAGDFTYTWTPADLPSGIYIYRLQIGHQSWSRRLVLE
ncbi:MAG: YCF48-related protein [Bacteroidota bacterium]